MSLLQIGVQDHAELFEIDRTSFFVAISYRGKLTKKYLKKINTWMKTLGHHGFAPLDRAWYLQKGLFFLGCEVPGIVKLLAPLNFGRISTFLRGCLVRGTAP